MSKLFSPDDLQHVMRMVFLENKGQVLTEAMMLGLENSIHHYLTALPHINGTAEPTPIFEDEQHET